MRLFEIDMKHCTSRSGKLKIISAILESAAIERILTHLGLQAKAPARGTFGREPDCGLAPRAVATGCAWRG